ncbi:DeoR family transcriptional regulator, partial [Lacticaseibacillus paracasei]
MKNSLANVQARRADIERLVDRHGIATVKGLALRLKVSEITIRRDLKILHAMGRVKWHNGLVEAIAGQGGGEQRTLAVIAQRIAAAVPNYIARYSTLFMIANSL